MNNWNLNEIKASDFKGFVSVSKLKNNFNQIPDERGVYLILKPDKSINFLKIGTGGYFKNKNPNVETDILRKKWIETALVIYIGQAGGVRNGKWSNSTLRKRIKDYLKFGNGKNIGHSGGRYIWQIEESSELIVCWKELPEKIEDPCKVESKLIQDFKNKYGFRPFANLKG